MSHLSYESPLITRYASKEMSFLFSAQHKHESWRKLWIALAEAQMELGLPIFDVQVEQMKQHIKDIDFDAVASYEKELQHDVMAHIHAFGDVCPAARPIIHLGATSCYVTDNTDLIQMRSGLKLLTTKLAAVLNQFAAFAKSNAHQACLGFTHFQPAQLTTVGKRACIWIQDLLLDLKEIEHRLHTLRFLGVKGTTGTQASFLSLFNGDEEKVKQLDALVAKKIGFTNNFIISGQTYARKQDSFILNTLSGIAISAHKFATDLRLLANLKELEEPFGENQVGSSAMPYKRNPMLSERICSLSRFVIALSENPSYTAATQWLERTLDDSANRRISLAESFLATDAILNLLLKVTSNLVVYPAVIEKHLNEELPFIATENILMACVKKGGDRQTLHERLRQHSIAAGNQVKKEGKANDLLIRIKADRAFNLTEDDVHNILNVNDFVGRSPQQVEEFLKNELLPAIQKYLPANLGSSTP